LILSQAPLYRCEQVIVSYDRSTYNALSDVNCPICGGREVN